MICHAVDFDLAILIKSRRTIRDIARPSKRALSSTCIALLHSVYTDVGVSEMKGRGISDLREKAIEPFPANMFSFTAKS